LTVGDAGTLTPIGGVRAAFIVPRGESPAQGGPARMPG
jgi:hypothetical protein